MKRVVFDDLYELSTEMIYEEKKFSDCVSVACHYDMATALIAELIRSDVPIGQIDICDYSWNAYDKEYIVSIMDECIYCFPAFNTEKGSYNENYADITYVHQDCNSKILKYLDCEKVYEFSVRELDEVDDESDDDMCACDDDITTYYSDSVSVSRDKLGSPTGFTKQWSTNNEDGIFSYTSYSFYCDNEDAVRYMAKQFDIEL